VVRSRVPSSCRSRSTAGRPVDPGAACLVGRIRQRPGRGGREAGPGHSLHGLVSSVPVGVVIVGGCEVAFAPGPRQASATRRRSGIALRDERVDSVRRSFSPDSRFDISGRRPRSDEGCCEPSAWRDESGSAASPWVLSRGCQSNQPPSLGDPPPEADRVTTGVETAFGRLGHSWLGWWSPTCWDR